MSGPSGVPLFVSQPGAPGGVGVGLLTVANMAALAATAGSNEGQLAFVQTIKAWFAFALVSALATDGITVAATPAGGTTRWVRLTNVPHPEWRAQATWQIDAAAGDDENAGGAATPIKTHAEWSRRVYPPTWQLTQSVTVTYTNVPPATDPLPLRSGFFAGETAAGVALFLTFQGPAYTAKAGHGGTITAVTARVRATNTPWDVTTTGTLDASDIGLRLQVTAGARAGAVTYPKKVLAANQVETSEWEITTMGPATFSDTHVTPSAAAGGDPTQIVLAQTLYIDRAEIFGGPQGSLVFQDLDIRHPNAGEPIQFYASGGGIMWNRCRFVDDPAVFYSATQEGTSGSFWGLVYLLNCFAGTTGATLPLYAFTSGDTATNQINGGLYYRVQLIAETAGSFTFDADVVVQAGAVGCNFGGVVLIGAGAVYDSPQMGFGIGAGCMMRSTIQFYGVRAMYGNGNTTTGISINDNAAMRYDAGQLAVITVAGPAGVDYQLSNQNLAWSFVNATALYQPVGGLATTYALLAAAVGGPGLGGQALFPGGMSQFTVAAGGVFP